MYSNKKLIFAVICILLIAAGWIFYNSKNKIAITTNGQEVLVKDFTGGISQPKNDTYNIENKPDYLIDYYIPDKLFSLVILNKDINYGRKQAENKLLKLLGISKNDACKLNVALYVPKEISPDYGGGIDYKLSFCPGGISFDNTTGENNSQTLFQKIINLLKNPLTVALGAAAIMLGVIILRFRR